MAGLVQSLYHSPADLLDKVKADLERESAARAEVETKYRESEASLKSIQAKSKQLIGALQQRVEEAETGKVKSVSVVKHTHTGACVHIQHVHTNMYTHTVPVYMHIHACMHARPHLHACMHACMHVCARAHTHTHSANTYGHTHAACVH